MNHSVAPPQDTEVLPTGVNYPHPYLANTPPGLEILSLLVKHYGRITEQIFYIQPLSDETGIIWQYGEQLPLMRYYSFESAIERVSDAIHMLERSTPVEEIDCLDWIEVLEAIELGVA